MDAYSPTYCSIPFSHLVYEPISGCLLECHLESINQFGAFFFVFQIIDDLVVDLVREMPQLVAYNYYGERFQYTKDGVLVIE